MMKLLADAINTYLSAEHNIKRLLTESKELMDNVNVYRLNSEDVQQYHTLYQAIRGLEEAYNSIVDLSKSFYPITSFLICCIPCEISRDETF